MSASQLKLKLLTNSSSDAILNQKINRPFSVFFSSFLILQNRVWVHWTNSCYAYTIKIVNDGRYILLRKGYTHIARTLFHLSRGRWEVSFILWKNIVCSLAYYHVRLSHLTMCLTSLILSSVWFFWMKECILGLIKFLNCYHFPVRFLQPV